MYMPAAICNEPHRPTVEGSVLYPYTCKLSQRCILKYTTTREMFHSYQKWMFSFYRLWSVQVLITLFFSVQLQLVHSFSHVVLKTKHVLVSTKRLLSEDRAEKTYWQLNGRWQFTSWSLMFVSLAAVQLSKEKLHTRSLRCFGAAQSAWSFQLCRIKLHINSTKKSAF